MNWQGFLIGHVLLSLCCAFLLLNIGYRPIDCLENMRNANIFAQDRQG